MAAQVEWASGEVPLVVHYAGCTFCRCTAVVASLQHHCPELRTVDSWQPTLSFHLSATARLPAQAALLHTVHLPATHRAAIEQRKPFVCIAANAHHLSCPALGT